MGNNRLSRGRHRHNQHLFFRPVMNSQTPAHIAHPKTIKSFVTRAGRTTGGQAKALAELGPRFVLPFQHGVFSAEQAFGRIAPLILEIGFGMGDATAQIALTRPDDNFLCCEVHEPGVGALLKRMGEASINNIRILQHDAVEVLEHMLAVNSVDGVHIFFPIHGTNCVTTNGAWYKHLLFNSWRNVSNPVVMCIAPPTGNLMPSICCKCCKQNRCCATAAFARMVLQTSPTTGH